MTRTFGSGQSFCSGRLMLTLNVLRVMLRQVTLSTAAFSDVSESDISDIILVVANDFQMDGIFVDRFEYSADKEKVTMCFATGGGSPVMFQSVVDSGLLTHTVI